MTDPVSTPIVVNPSQVPEQVATAVRYLVTSIGSFALGKGWISGDALQAVTGVITIGLPIAWGLYQTYVNKQKLVTVAASPSVPNFIATLKGDAK